MLQKRDVLLTAKSARPNIATETSRIHFLAFREWRSKGANDAPLYLSPVSARDTSVFSIMTAECPIFRLPALSYFRGSRQPYPQAERREQLRSPGDQILGQGEIFGEADRYAGPSFGHDMEILSRCATP